MPSSQARFSFIAVLRAALGKLPSNLHWLFLLFAIPQVVFLALLTPPFQTADEPAHFDRAWQIAHFEFGPHYGGTIDTGFDRLWLCTAGISFHPNVRYTRADRMAAESAQWTGVSTYRDFPNTGTGAVTGYIPQALAIAIGRAAALRPLRTLELARLLNGAFAIAVCAFALSRCGRGRLVMFAVLLMPMSLSLFASCGQDATLIALACLAIALISRQLDRGEPLSRWQAFIVVASFIVVVVGRPPYVALLLAFLIPGIFPRLFKDPQNRPSWLAGPGFALLSFALTAIWWLTAMHITHAVAKPVTGIGAVDARMQLTNLIQHPGIIRDLFSYAVHHTAEYIAGAIGYLGWLDTPMPALYYLVMLFVLALAALAEMAHGPGPRKIATVLLFAAAGAGVAAVFIVEYLIWAPVGAHAIYGVQGRYFIPLAIAAAAGLPRLSNSATAYQRLTAIVVAAQLITAFVLPPVIMARYYGI